MGKMMHPAKRWHGLLETFVRKEAFCGSGALNMGTIQTDWAQCYCDFGSGSPLSVDGGAEELEGGS